MCIKKRGEEFCKKLQLACFELMKLPIGVAGKNGEPQLPQPVLFCISSENWMAQCFMRYGEGNCMAWRSVCMEKYSKVAGELSDSEKECIKSQTVIHKCVLKYNAKFCYKIIAVCSDIYKVPYTEGPVQKLPPTVVSCLYSENVVVLCRAKHGVTFCKRLGTACSKLTHVTLPDFTTDVSITMPVVIATCIREENYIATLFVEFGFQKVESWVSRCKITQITSGAITVVQKECLQKLSVEPDPRTVCVQKYGNEFCSLLIEACFKIKNIRLKGSVICPSCVLPEPVFECISKEEFVAMCYARYGIPRCLAYMEECGVAGKEGQMIGAKDWQCIQKRMLFRPFLTIFWKIVQNFSIFWRLVQNFSHFMSCQFHLGRRDLRRGDFGKNIFELVTFQCMKCRIRW
ncbi:unnamed protein product [Anisakis simplex]|uniref:Kazal-like domain-containing protein n=1 Tax=Anisakis simplex TaxID=6269 RepID=A0A0M3J425_ANISI|nr:unnamed protein product [Anisakis simplex]